MNIMTLIGRVLKFIFMSMFRKKKDDKGQPKDFE
ncbi:hypothetical protein PHOBOS_183 [Erwinia phage vB_EamM_Phobos]|nr:hypothetical protein BIZ79_gp183 [Erwinia phage vB_EamM_Phobos]ANZ50373.1 hypothetical protein PHOBOS_183 [Erwinia phage vB_EamM_Phobos]